MRRGWGQYRQTTRPTTFATPYVRGVVGGELVVPLDPPAFAVRTDGPLHDEKVGARQEPGHHHIARAYGAPAVRRHGTHQQHVAVFQGRRHGRALDEHRVKLE
jgi:hypothetical protein